MKLETKEFRTEEEFVGNLLIISATQKGNASDEQILYKLWCEAEEFAEDTDDEVKRRYFDEAKKRYLHAGTTQESVKSKINEIYTKFDRHFDGTPSEASQILSSVKSDVIRSISLSILEDDYSSYVLVIISEDKSSFFSWQDVI